MKYYEHLFVNPKNTDVTKIDLEILLGENEARMLSRLVFRLGVFKRYNYPLTDEHYASNRWWYRCTVSRWKKVEFPKWSETKIKRTLNNLEKMGLITHRTDLCKDPKFHDSWYTANYDAIDALYEDGLKNCQELRDYLDYLDKEEKEEEKRYSANNQNNPNSDNNYDERIVSEPIEQNDSDEEDMMDVINGRTSDDEIVWSEADGGWVRMDEGVVQNEPHKVINKSYNTTKGFSTPNKNKNTLFYDSKTLYREKLSVVVEDELKNGNECNNRPYLRDRVLNIARMFESMYYQKFGRECTCNPSDSKKIVSAMTRPFGRDKAILASLDEEDVKWMIERHFETKYKGNDMGCDHGILLFLKPKTLANRYYELDKTLNN